MFHTIAGKILKSSHFWLSENPGCYSMGIIPMWNYMCLVGICTTNSITREAKCSWFL
jgi:hypothetical protein